MRGDEEWLLQALSLRCESSPSDSLEKHLSHVRDVKQKSSSPWRFMFLYEPVVISDIFAGRSSDLIAASRCKAALLLS